MLTDEQLRIIRSAKEFDLTSIASFTRKKEIAEGWVIGAKRTMESFGIKGHPVIIEVPSLKSGVDVSKYAGALKGQQETITSGKLKIISFKGKEGSFYRILAEHEVTMYI